MNEETVPENSSPIKIRPRDLPQKKKKRKKAPAKSAPPIAVDPVIGAPTVSAAPRPEFESNVERAQFLLRKKAKRKKAFFKKGAIFTKKDEVEEPADADQEEEIYGEEIEESKNASGDISSLLSLENIFAFLRTHRVVLIRAAVFVVVILIFSVIFYQRGFTAGTRYSDEVARKENVELPKEVTSDLDDALQELRYGNARKALEHLLVIESKDPQYSSLTYLSALAALQSGNSKIAQSKAEESIAKRERISDALGIEAVLEMQKSSEPSKYRVSDPRLNAEAIMRRAIVADAANPYPHFELANLLRSLGRRDEAIQEIKAAQVRLNPMDSHLVMEVTLALMTVENTAVGQLKESTEQTDDLRKLFPEALVAMRLGDFTHAAEYLRVCRQHLPPEVFDYLVNDPAFRQFVHEPQLAEFYPGN